MRDCMHRSDHGLPAGTPPMGSIFGVTGGALTGATS
jgi:hypothetical protein